MNTMFYGRLKNPYKSNFDVFHTLKVYNRILGIACFTTVKRDDGVEIHFADTGDQIYSAALIAITTAAYCMIFFWNVYPDDSTFDAVVYKAFFSYAGMGGNVCRYILSRRINTFLKALHLIQVVDEKFKSKGIPVNYEASRNMAKLTIIFTVIAYPCVIYSIYNDIYISDDMRLYHFINLSMSSTLNVGTVMMECMYFMIIAMTLKQRFEDLSLYTGKLKKTKNYKIVAQELQMISILHMKLCQSWTCTTESMGAGVICQHGLLYMYLMYPLVYFEYVLPRMKNEMAPVLVVTFYVTYKILNTCGPLKSAANGLKKAVIELDLERGDSEPVIRKMCKTLLLQMEHVDIKLVLGGFFVIDLESLLTAIKGSSVNMMFFLQMNNPNIV